MPTAPPLSATDAVRLRIRRGPDAVTVVLHADHERILEEAKEEICDYRTGRVCAVDRRCNGYRERALLSDIVYLQTECANRLHISRVVGEGGGDLVEGIVTPVDARHSLGVGAAEHLDELTWHGRCALVEGRALFECSEETLAVPPKVVSRFCRYLRRTLGGHPGIWHRLEGEGQLPRRIQLWLGFGGDREHTDITIVSWELLPCEPHGLHGLERFEVLGDPIWSALVAARAQGPRLPAELDDLDASLRELAAAEQFIPMLLCILEATLCHATVPEKLVEAIGVLGKADPLAAVFMEALQSGGSPLDERLAACEALRSHAGEYAHMVDVFRGSLLWQAELLDEALDAYRAALAVQPRITGPYHDIGRILARQFRHADAFRCWELAEFLSPGLAIMDDVRALCARCEQAERATPAGRFLAEG